jgi:hypothetical protein
MARTRQGKIARLPHVLREEINRRLSDGETGGTILSWLNAHVDAVRIWDQHFEGAPATAQNLSEWRLGGYRDWQMQRQKVEDLKTLSSHAAQLAQAGQGVESGSTAILAGHIMESWETLLYAGGTSADENGEGGSEADLALNFARLTQAATRLKKASIDEQKMLLAQRQANHKEKELALSREKFEHQTVQKFIQWAKSPEATAILDSGKPAAVQMDLMRELMFGAAN